MRRPVKPFVTEYKGPNRRPSHPSGPAQRLQTEEFSYATTANEVFSRSAGEHAARGNPEDAYEAALRAADALFSPQAEKTVAPAVTVPRVVNATAPPDQDQPAIEAEARDLAAHGHGGRILRAIDEPPVPGLADIEAEREPKRRGRKPGSKNKPKAPVFVDDAPRAPAAARPTQSAPPLGFSSDEIESALPSPAPAPRPATMTGLRTRDNERFSWVRTKLKPGEEWKRRLPKVCW